MKTLMMLVVLFFTGNLYSGHLEDILGYNKEFVSVDGHLRVSFSVLREAIREEALSQGLLLEPFIIFPHLDMELECAGSDERPSDSECVVLLLYVKVFTFTGVDKIRGHRVIFSINSESIPFVENANVVSLDSLFPPPRKETGLLW